MFLGVQLCVITFVKQVLKFANSIPICSCHFYCISYIIFFLIFVELSHFMFDLAVFLYILNNLIICYYFTVQTVSFICLSLFYCMHYASLLYVTVPLYKNMQFYCLFIV